MRSPHTEARSLSITLTTRNGKFARFLERDVAFVLV